MNERELRSDGFAERYPLTQAHQARPGSSSRRDDGAHASSRQPNAHQAVFSVRPLSVQTEAAPKQIERADARLVRRVGVAANESNASRVARKSRWERWSMTWRFTSSLKTGLPFVRSRLDTAGVTYMSSRSRHSLPIACVHRLCGKTSRSEGEATNHPTRDALDARCPTASVPRCHVPIGQLRKVPGALGLGGNVNPNCCATAERRGRARRASGGPRRTRTFSQRIKSPLLYQLSYWPEKTSDFAKLRT
jgi:hypothetical protein